MDIAIAVALTVFAAVALLASRRDLRTMRDYRQRFTREVGGDAQARLAAADRRSAKRDLRRGRAISDPAVADMLIRQYEAVGMPPDFTRRTRIAGIGGTTIVCVLAAVAGSYLVAIPAGACLLALLAASVWQWRLSRSMIVSVVATRRTHQS